MTGNKNLPQLPKGWMWTPIKEILDKFESGGRPKGGARNIQAGIASIGGEHLTSDGHFDFSNIRYVPIAFFEQMNKGLVNEGDILIVKDGATTGKTSIIRENFPFQQAVVNEHVFLARPSQEIDDFYVFYYLFSPFGQDYVRQNFRGTVQGGITLSFFENTLIPLPPLPEQYRIAAKIEELLTKLDAGVDALNKIKLQLRRYRQAVLKYTFEGKLTEEWQEAHKSEVEFASVLLERIKEEREKNVKGKLKDLPRMATSDLAELPEGWEWTRLGEISEIVLGQSPPSSTYNEDGNGLPFYQGKLEFGNTYPTARKWCSSPKKIAEKGDVLISVRAPVGPTNICPDKSCIGRGLAAIRGLGGIESHFILYLLRASENVLAGKGTGTTFNAITGDQLRTFRTPLPPLSEQRRIVEEIERCFSVADAIEKDVEQSLKQAERLRQSILKRAFEGKLVPQDPTDEPAENLLERIRTERARIEAKKKVTGKTRRS